MKNQIKKKFRLMKDLLIHFFRDFSIYFYKGWQASLFIPYTKSFLRSLIFYLNQFRLTLYSDGIQHYHIKEEKMKKLQSTALGLHALFPQDARFSYSILLPVSEPRPVLFQKSLESIFNQTAPSLEILIGLMKPPSENISNLLVHIQQQHPLKVKIFNFFQNQEKEEIFNQLADQASGHFLFMMGEEDWIRPDCFFRFEQTLRMFSDPENRVLYCNLNRFNDKGYFIPNSEYLQPSQLNFPFFFKSFLEKGLLIPAALWKKTEKLQTVYKGAEYEHLLLQLDLAGALFQHVPLSLYSLSSPEKQRVKKSQQALLKVLKRYSQEKQLNWEWFPGYQNHTVRALPHSFSRHVIQVIIPYKDQKDLTMKCIQSVLKQQNVQIKITAINNRSTDVSIAENILALGEEVISVDEPFNYSRLNNLAIKHTKKGTHCDVVLFLNNDVELEPDALSEMLRWIDQPKIGMIGCRLHYPDGRLQHGGVNMNFQNKEEMRWEHVEKLRRFEEMDLTKTLSVVDAVTAACAMMKRQTFLDVGGFDEMWYPIGYSDTNLAIKVAAKGLICFYTPYASGIHHESVSRKNSIEDYENSWWLHHLWMKHQTNHIKNHFHENEKNLLRDFLR